jgi:hypothetical protein
MDEVLMKRPRAISMLLAASMSACLPVQQTEKNEDTVLRTYEVDGAHGTSRILLTIDPSATEISATAETVTTCTREGRREVKRWHDVERHTNHVVHGLIYALGALALVAGDGIIADNALATNPGAREIKIGSSTTTGFEVGGGVAAAGAALLAYAIGSSVHAEDSRDFVGTVQLSVPGSAHVADCERVPATGQALSLAFSAGCSQPVYVPIGTTDAKGHVSAAWAAVLAQATGCAAPDADVVVGDPASLVAAATAKRSIESLGHVTIPEGTAWDATVTADTAEAYRVFAARFPSSAHGSQAAERGKAARLRSAQKDFEAGLTSNHLDQADAALATLRTVADPAVVADAEKRLTAAHQTARIEDARKRFPEALAAIGGSSDPAMQIAQAKSAIDVLQDVDADQASRDQKQLDEARKNKIDQLVRDGQGAFARRDFDAGKKLFDAAVTISPDVPAIEKQRTSAKTRAVRAGHDEARTLAHGGKYEEAIAILDALGPQAPDDKTIPADRTRWAAAIEQTARDTAEKQAREAARADRDRKAKEEHEASEQAARDRATAEQAARDERARLQAEARARDDADRKARDTAARQAAEQARQTAEAERARKKADEEARKQAVEQQRLATEAEKARVAAEKEARAAEEARRRADEAARRAHQDPGAPSTTAPAAPPPVPQPTATTVTVQFELPGRMATDDVTKHIPVPHTCRATTNTFMAISPLCTTCDARPVSQMVLACDAQGSFTFTRDTTHVWLTCSNAAGTTCATCLAAGRAALGQALGPKDKLSVVKGCP